jgi:hypothetical protein
MPNPGFRYFRKKYFKNINKPFYIRLTNFVTEEELFNLVKNSKKGIEKGYGDFSKDNLLKIENIINNKKDILLSEIENIKNIVRENHSRFENESLDNLELYLSIIEKVYSNYNKLNFLFEILKSSKDDLERGYPIKSNDKEKNININNYIEFTKKNIDDLEKKIIEINTDARVGYKLAIYIFKKIKHFKIK